MVLFVGGVLALISNTVYWVELFDIGWSYSGTIMLQAVVFTVTVLAALYVVMVVLLWFRCCADLV